MRGSTADLIKHKKENKPKGRPFEITESEKIFKNEEKQSKPKTQDTTKPTNICN